MAFAPGFIRAKLVGMLPFLGEYIIGMEAIEDNTVKTICTNGEEIRYNKEFMDSRNINDQLFLYVHEVVHVFLAHPWRIRPEHIFDIAQQAADYVTNELVVTSTTLTLPSGALYDYKYFGMGYEEVYAELIKNNNTNKRDTSKQGTVEKGSTGEEDAEDQSDDPLANKSDAKEEKRKAKLKEAEAKMEQAIQVASMVGEVSPDLKRIFNKLTEKKTDWRTLLPTKVELLMGEDDYTFAVTNTSIDDDEFIYPGMSSEKTKDVVIIVDTSGSISNIMLTMMVSEIVTLIEAAEPERVHIISVDSSIKNIQVFEEGDTDIQNQIDLKGGGFTSFRPGFYYVDSLEEPPGSIIYLTDGLCSSYPENSYDSTIWLVYGKLKTFKPPFGDVMFMD